MFTESKMTTRFQEQNKVTQLHKGLGPRLFQCQLERDRDTNYASNLSSPIGPSPRKRIVVKCVPGQDANSTFQRRLRERNPPRNSKEYRNAGVISTKREAQRGQKKGQTVTIKEIHKPSNFPPPSFMPRWNPRHKDRTYLDKMYLEDPWSLPSAQRAELQRRTGLRLKSISRHYQFKVGSQLPFGKDALDGKCTCHVEFCDHCSKSHEYRCPLHMQLLDPLQADCKLQISNYFCPFRKNPEDMALGEIKDLSVYVSEVVRRLKAGEISEVPPFPDRFELNKNDIRKTENLLPGQSLLPKETPSQLDAARKAPTDSNTTQTEPFDIDLDMRGDTRESYCQTMQPSKDEPMMLSVLKSMEHQLPFKGFQVHNEKGVQVTVSELEKDEDNFNRICETLARKIIEQSLQEVGSETNLAQIRSESGDYMHEHREEQHRLEFRLLQENFRFNLNLQESIDLEVQMAEEALAETLIGAISFAQSCVSTMPTRAMYYIRKCGRGTGKADVNEDLDDFHDDLITQSRRTFVLQEASRYLLDDMTAHALLDLELNYFQQSLVDAQYLQVEDLPPATITRPLRDLVAIKGENIERLKRIRDFLVVKGWIPKTDSATDSSSSSGSSLDIFVDKVRVSLDSAGKPKYLVDEKGRQLPINVAWLPQLEYVVGADQDHKWDSKRMFSLLLEETRATLNPDDPKKDSYLSEVGEGEAPKKKKTSVGYTESELPSERDAGSVEVDSEGEEVPELEDNDVDYDDDDEARGSLQS